MATKSTAIRPLPCKDPEPHPGIIRLPVAPRANHRLRFTPVSEPKPQAIMPTAALAKVEELMANGGLADAVLLDGPGDPLADVELPLETIHLLKKTFPAMTICLRTLGIGGLQHADRFQQAGVTEVELLVDGVEIDVIERIYAWIRPGFKTVRLGEAARVLLAEQEKAIQAFKDAGLTVRIITTLYPTVNDDHLELLARKMGDLKADELVLQPHTPAPGADILLPDTQPERVAALIAAMEAYLPVREGRPAAQGSATRTQDTGDLPKPRKDRPNIAVVSSNGMDIDLHLGQAPQLLVYGPREDGLNCLLECRPVPDAGNGSDRWDLLAGRLPDCFALLAANAGERPRKILDGHGIQVIITRNSIDATVDTIFGGGKAGRKRRTAHS